MLELILGADGEVDLSFELSGYLEDAIAPVVGSLGVLLVVHAVVGNDQWVLEVSGGVTSAETDQAMAGK